jgi:small GTP-binding protein
MSQTFSIAVLGSGGVGKTCLILRLTKGTFDTDYIPTIQDYFEKRLSYEGNEYNLRVIDTAGQDEMGGITDIGIQDAHACVIVYSVNSQVSFNECEKWRERVRSFHPDGPQRIVLCGNKSDMADRPITKKMGEDVANRWGCEFIETSAKENININELFLAALRTLLPKKTVPKKRQAKKEIANGCCNVQ